MLGLVLWKGHLALQAMSHSVQTVRLSQGVSVFLDVSELLTPVTMGLSCKLLLHLASVLLVRVLDVHHLPFHFSIYYSSSVPFLFSFFFDLDLT